MTVAIKHYPGIVLISVSDASDVPPRLQPLNRHAERGRGRQLVDALSLRWGTDPPQPGPGKTVWAQIDCKTSRQMPSGRHRNGYDDAVLIGIACFDLIG